MNNQLKDKKVLILGANGFVGKNLLSYLFSDPNWFTAKEFMFPTSKQLDCTNQKAVFDYFANKKPDVVLHLAGKVGGINANRGNPATFFYQNDMMGLNIFEACRINGVEKLVALAAGCGMPEDVNPPYRETDLFDGLPDMNSYGYSMAKKNLVVQSWAYREEFGFDSTILLPANLYGPHDNFHLEHSHVVPAMIRKFVEAREIGEKPVKLWGTGNATREFLFVEDVCKAIVDAVASKKSGPFNLGTGVETPIRELALIIKEIVGYKGYIMWDARKPDGQSRRFYDMSKFQKEFGYIPNVSLHDGLVKTIKWFEQNRTNARL